MKATIASPTGDTRSPFTRLPLDSASTAPRVRPQFSWCKSKLPRKPQPVPPIFQREVAARALYWAAHHRTRELWVGSSTVKAIIGQKIIPVCSTSLGKTGPDKVA